MSAEPRAVRDVLATVRRTIDRRGMLKGGERVVVACSGGPDSLALLHVLARLAPEHDLELHVAHFDHRWRAGSERDASFVARAAARLGIPATIRASDSPARPPGLSPEEAAREQRHAFLRDVRESVGAARIATGHTLDDQAETVLMHFLIGTGRRGLSGIPPVRWWMIRPLIDVRRAQTEAFCRALRLRPRRDPTNDDPAYLRNAIRAEVLPFLEGRINARLSEALVRTSDVVRDEDYELDRRASALAEPEVTPEGSRLPIGILRELSRALQRRAIRLLARTEGEGLDLEKTEAVRALALGGETGKSLDLGGGLSARAEYGFLVVGRARPSSPAPPISVALAVPGETDLPTWGTRARAWIAAERPASFPDGTTTAVLDADRIAFPLRVRRWRQGDRFRPLGMPRPKKVGDFFTDEKVERARRAEVPLVVAEDGTIVWVVGHRIDDRVKVTRSTRRHLWLAVEGES